MERLADQLTSAQRVRLLTGADTCGPGQNRASGWGRSSSRTARPVCAGAGPAGTSVPPRPCCPRRPPSGRYSVDGEVLPLPPVERMFVGRTDGAGAWLRVRPDPDVDVIFFAHSPAEIAFDVSVWQLRGQGRVDLLSGLLAAVGRGLGKPPGADPSDQTRPEPTRPPRADRTRSEAPRPPLHLPSPPSRSRRLAADLQGRLPARGLRRGLRWGAAAARGEEGGQGEGGRAHRDRVRAQ